MVSFSTLTDFGLGLLLGSVGGIFGIGGGLIAIPALTRFFGVCCCPRVPPCCGPEPLDSARFGANLGNPQDMRSRWASAGNNLNQVAAISKVPMPPETTEATGPHTAATLPDSNSPS